MKDGSLYVWGNNSIYFPTLPETIPFANRVKVADNVKKIDFSGNYVAILKNDNTLWVCGSRQDIGTIEGVTYNNEDEIEQLTKIADNIVDFHITGMYSSYSADILILTPDGVMTDLTAWASPGPLSEDVMLPSFNGVTPVDPNTPSPWAEAPIASAIAKGFVPEDLQTGYKNTISRLDFCRLAVKYMEYATGKTIDDILAEKGLQRDSTAFTDVTNTDVLAAYALGITSGAGEGIFNPNGQFTRESAAGMIINLHRAMGKDTRRLPASPTPQASHHGRKRALTTALPLGS